MTRAAVETLHRGDRNHASKPRRRKDGETDHWWAEHEASFFGTFPAPFSSGAAENENATHSQKTGARRVVKPRRPVSEIAGQSRDDRAWLGGQNPSRAPKHVGAEIRAAFQTRRAA
jgi:hypothetical protein